jgi:hypothetical protein
MGVRMISIEGIPRYKALDEVMLLISKEIWQDSGRPAIELL